MSLGGGRDELASQRSDRPPPAAVLEKIEAELAEPSTLKKVYGYTWRRMRLLAAFGFEAGPDVVEEFVNQALLDTMEGTLTWDPSRARLSTHLCGAIRSRTWKKATRPSRVVLEGLPEEGALQPDNLTDAHSPADAALEFEQRTLDTALVTSVRAHLDALVAERRDDDVGLLLMAYDEGTTGRTEISVLTGMSVDDVTNARKRLARILRELPPGLLDETQNRLKGDL